MLVAVTAPTRTHRIHPAWWVAAVTFLALVGAAAFRAVPGVLIDPLRAEFGWSVTTISAAVAVNMALYGLTAPFAAAPTRARNVTAATHQAGWIRRVVRGRTVTRPSMTDRRGRERVARRPTCARIRP